MSEKPVLYKCPYCTKGRFTADDGWDVAVAHVKSHSRGKKKRNARGTSSRKPSPTNWDDLDTPLSESTPPSYDEIQELMD